MTDKELELMYKSSKELEPRKELKKKILALAIDTQSPSKTTVAEPKTSVYKRLKLWVPIAACLVLAIIIGAAWGLNSENYQTVYIDVNPSVAIQLNRFDNVSGVEALNKDAQGLLADMDLVGLTAEEALCKVIEAFDKKGYLDSEAELYISTEKNKDTSGELLERLKKRAEETKGNKGYTVNTCRVTEEERESAKDAGISAGKYQVISQIIELDSTYTVEELKDMSMSELKKLQKELRK